jgi:hypothetical protein
VQLDGASYSAVAKINEFGGSQDATLVLHRHDSALGTAANMLLTKSSSETSSHGNVADNDVLGRLIFAGWHTASYYRAAEIDVLVNGTPGAGDMPGEILFKISPDGSNTPANMLRIADGFVDVMNDNDELRIGAGNDLRLYHDGTNSYIDNDTGQLRFPVADNTAAPILFQSSARGIRLGHQNGYDGFGIEGVDNTGVGSFQPLTLGGSQVSITDSGTPLARFNSGSSAGMLELYPSTGVEALGMDGWPMLKWSDSSVIHLGGYNSSQWTEVRIGASGNPVGIFNTSGLETPSGGVKTANPNTSAVYWRLGSASAVSPTSPNRTLEVMVNGTLYYIHAKTTND